jgi:hypothetical protein
MVFPYLKWWCSIEDPKKEPNLGHSWGHKPSGEFFWEKSRDHLSIGCEKWGSLLELTTKKVQFQWTKWIYFTIVIGCYRMLQGLVISQLMEFITRTICENPKNHLNTRSKIRKGHVFPWNLRAIGMISGFGRAGFGGFAWWTEIIPSIPKDLLGLVSTNLRLT